MQMAFPRNLSGKINVIHNKKLYPQVGSITMDQMMVDITGSNEIKIGSTMILLGSDGDKTISPLDWAKNLILFLGKFFVLLKIDYQEFKLIRHFD